MTDARASGPSPSGDERRVELVRLGRGHYRATTASGATLELSAGSEAEGERFSPVELLLAALAGCGAIDVDFLTSRRAEPEAFTVTASGQKTRDEGGNRLDRLSVRFDVRFPDGEDGDAARAMLGRAVKASHDRLCTVSRTIEAGTPVAVEVVDGAPTEQEETAR